MDLCPDRVRDPQAVPTIHIPLGVSMTGPLAGNMKRGLFQSKGHPTTGRARPGNSKEWSVIRDEAFGGDWPVDS